MGKEPVFRGECVSSVTYCLRELTPCMFPCKHQECMSPTRDLGPIRRHQEEEEEVEEAEEGIFNGIHSENRRISALRSKYPATAKVLNVNIYSARNCSGRN